MGTLPVQPREVIAMNCAAMLVRLLGGQKMTRAQPGGSTDGKGESSELREGNMTVSCYSCCLRSYLLSQTCREQRSIVVGVFIYHILEN